MKGNPSAITILVDSQERMPLQFPKTLLHHSALSSPLSPNPSRVQILVRKTHLPTGDYALDMGTEPSDMIIERKMGFKEIHTNCCTSDRSRFMRCLDRLAVSCRRPVLLFEGSTKAVSTAYLPESHALLALSILLHELSIRNISFLSFPSATQTQRAHIGHMAALLLLSSQKGSPIQESMNGVVPCVLPPEPDPQLD